MIRVVSANFWFNYLLALIVVALMLAGLWIVVRTLARGRIIASADRRLVAVLESTVVSQHASLHVVKVGARYLLIGGGSAQLTMLSELDATDVDAWLAQQRTSFGVQNASLAAALQFWRRKK